MFHKIIIQFLEFFRQTRILSNSKIKGIKDRREIFGKKLLIRGEKKVLGGLRRGLPVLEVIPQSRRE